MSMVLHWETGEEEPWYLATDQPATWRTIQTYKVRMWTEEMYGDMKGHGFDLESTHLQDLDRLSRLVLGVCLVYVWLISLGSWVVKNGLRHWVDRKDRRDKSYFRLGWDWLERCLAQGQSLDCVSCLMDQSDRWLDTVEWLPVFQRFRTIPKRRKKRKTPPVSVGPRADSHITLLSLAPFNCRAGAGSRKDDV